MDYISEQREKEEHARETRAKYARAFFLVGLAGIAGGFGIFVRWAQNMTAYEEGTGLYIIANRWGGAIAFLLLAVIFGIIFFVYKFAYFQGLASPKGYRDAFMVESGIIAVVHRIVWILITFLSLASALLIFKDSDEVRYPGMLLILSAFVFLNSIAFALAAISMKNPVKPVVLRIAFLFPILTLSFWLLYTYRSDTVTPVIWRYSLEIPALCSSLLAYFFIAGYAYGRESDYSTVVFCVLGAFLSIISLPDDRIKGLGLLYIVNAAQLLLFVFVQAYNMAPYKTSKRKMQRSRLSDRLMGISAEESALERAEAAALISSGSVEKAEKAPLTSEQAEDEIPQPEEEPEAEDMVMDLDPDYAEDTEEKEAGGRMAYSDGDDYIEAEPVIVLDESGERWQEWDFEEARREQKRRREENPSDFFIDDEEIF